MKFQHCKIIKNTTNGSYEIKVSWDSTFNTVCISMAEAEKLCARIESIIEELENWKSLIKSMKQEDQKRIKKERDKILKRFLEALQIQREKEKKLLEEINLKNQLNQEEQKHLFIEQVKMLEYYLDALRTLREMEEKKQQQELMEYENQQADDAASEFSM